MYNYSVWIDTSHIVVKLENNDKTVDETIPRGVYTTMSIVTKIADGFNSIDRYRILDQEENGGIIFSAPRSNEHPSMVVISNDNPFIPVSPGITRRLEFTFYRNWDIGMPELTSRYEFAMANIDGLTAENMINENTYSDRTVSIEFIQPTRIGFT